MKKILLFLFILLIPAMAQRSVIRTLSNAENDKYQGYAEIFFCDSAVALSLGADAYAAVVNGDSTLFTATGTDTIYKTSEVKDAIIVDNAGYYLGIFDLSFKADDTDTVFVALGVNSTADSLHEAITKVDSLTHHHIGSTGIYALSASDTVRMFAKSIVGEDLTLISGNVILFKLRRQ